MPDCQHSQGEASGDASQVGNLGTNSESNQKNNDGGSQKCGSGVDVRPKNGWDAIDEEVTDSAATHSGDPPEERRKKWVQVKLQRFCGSGDGAKRKPSGVHG